MKVKKIYITTWYSISIAPNHYLLHLISLSSSIIELILERFHRISLSDSTCSSQKAFTRQGRLLDKEGHLPQNAYNFRGAFIGYEVFI